MYRNSNRKGSAYVGAGWQPIKVGEWRFGAIAGLVTGYQEKSPRLMAVAFISYKDVHFTVIPQMKNKTPLTVGFSWVWR